MADIVHEACRKYRNWGKWGANDDLGTLNYVTPEIVVNAARMVRRGVNFSLSIPFGSTGPQINQPRRFNPIHRMILTGPDCTTGAFRRPGGVDRPGRRAARAHGPDRHVPHAGRLGRLRGWRRSRPLVPQRGLGPRTPAHRGRHQYVGHGSPPERDPEHVPAPPPRRRLRVHVRRPADPHHRSRGFTRQPFAIK